MKSTTEWMNNANEVSKILKKNAQRVSNLQVTLFCKIKLKSLHLRYTNFFLTSNLNKEYISQKKNICIFTIIVR